MSRENLLKQVGAAAQAYQASVEAFDEAVARRMRINSTDLRCIEVLLQEDSVTPGRLAVALGLTTGSVTAMLDRMTRLGYLSRSPDPMDRRKIVVRATDRTRELTTELYLPLAVEGERDVLGHYTDEELEVVLDFLTRARQLQERHHQRVIPRRP
ncbi:MarR family transcriptional regulator [Streptosporangiaceae bacterium NEAU-GS5]|nr:MarR family transcriptional regulator [Streptosporangiaceae bacterium NEAU-GS5]